MLNAYLYKRSALLEKINFNLSETETQAETVIHTLMGLTVLSAFHSGKLAIVKAILDYQIKLLCKDTTKLDLCKIG
jgi:hypothetical protein